MAGNLENATWRVSSYSGGSGQCVEVAVAADRVGVRDSKARTAGHQRYGRPAWDALLTAVKSGQMS